MTVNLGESGSLTLIGATTSFPEDLSGNAYPVLVSLKDNAGIEYVNLARSGGADCAGSGFFVYKQVYGYS